MSVSPDPRSARVASRLTARDRRALLVGAIVVLLTAAVGRGAPAYAAWRDGVAAERAEATGELARARAAIAARVARAEALTATRRRVAAYDTLLLGADEAAVTSAIAREVADAAEYAGIAVGAVGIHVDSLGVPGARSHRLLHARLRADITGTGSQLVELLAWLEQCPPLLAVRELVVSPLDPDAPRDRDEILRATIEVEGLGIAPLEPALTSTASVP